MPGMQVIGPEEKYRGKITRSNPSLTKMIIPDFNNSQLQIWPPRSAFMPFAPPSFDPNTSSEWGTAAAARRRAANEQVDRQLLEAEATKREFFRARD